MPSLGCESLGVSSGNQTARRTFHIADSHIPSPQYVTSGVSSVDQSARRTCHRENTQKSSRQCANCCVFVVSVMF